MKKCIVFGCTNCDNDGVFVGELCNPCHQMIVTGDVGRHGSCFLVQQKSLLDQYISNYFEVKGEIKNYQQRFEKIQRIMEAKTA